MPNRAGDLISDINIVCIQIDVIAINGIRAPTTVAPAVG